MTSIQDLFADAGPTRSDGSTRGAASEERLGLLVGSSRPASQADAVVDDSVALRALVGGRGRAVEAGGPAPSPTRVRRAGVTRDWLSAGAAIIAVVAVAAALAVTGAVAASASPQKSALENLSDVEGQLVDRSEGINRSIVAAENLQEAIVTGAAGLPGVLAALNGISDEAARVSAEQVRADVVTQVQSIELPGALAPYRRAAIDSSSLVEIGAAIDNVGELQLQTDPVVAEVARGTRALRDADKKLSEALKVFVATVPAFAAGLVEEAPGVGEEFHVAVTEAAAVVAQADLRTAVGQSAVTGYAEAVTALRSEQERVVEEERRLALQQPTPYRSGGQTDTNVEQPTVPDTTPVDPDPGPTEPVEPDPGPTVEPTPDLGSTGGDGS